MYLKQTVIENSGPLRRFALKLAFTDEGAPKPLILVGTNGGGKTNFLSLVTDAIFETAARHYENVLPASGLGRAWFRVVGGRTTTVGEAGNFSLLRFEDAGEALVYKEKAGILDASGVIGQLPADLQAYAQWPTEGPVKEMSVNEDKARRIFEEGLYVYFPSSRSEAPYWLNRESIPETEFDLSSNFTKRLRKPIFVERGLHAFKQWVISVIVEARIDLGMVMQAQAAHQLQVNGNSVNVNVINSLMGMNALNVANLILRKILDDDDVQFVWTGRKNPDKLAVAKGGKVILPSLDALSGGQSILLTLFGTLLRYGDQSQGGATLDLSAIKGICIVDEIDAHIHVDLQNRILPSLIQLFPNIQFIISSHSPLFVLGMEKVFGADGFLLAEMPDGKVVTAETYSEFGRAMEALTATEAFSAKLLSEASQGGVPAVFLEGETDAPYLRRAAEILGRASLLDRCKMEWIGAKDDAGQGFHTGKAALDHTLSVFRANPELVGRPILLLYDNDAKKTDVDYGTVSVRGMPTNPNNTVVRAGIENLLSADSISDEDYQTVESVKPNGDVFTRKSLRKTELCERMCVHGTVEDFKAFDAALDKIAAYLDVFAPLPLPIDAPAG